MTTAADAPCCDHVYRRHTVSDWRCALCGHTGSAQECLAVLESSRARARARASVLWRRHCDEALALANPAPADTADTAAPREGAGG